MFKLKKIAFAGIVGLVILAGHPKDAGATLVDSNSIFQDGIEYYIQTNKSVYNLGEDVEILYRITNLRDEELYIMALAPVQDFFVAQEESGQSFKEIWRWGWFNVPIAGPGVLSLQPNESAEISDIWPQLDWMETWELEDDAQVPPGRYRIYGVVNRVEMVNVDINIIPEPCSLVLFATGMSILIYSNKKRSR